MTIELRLAYSCWIWTRPQIFDLVILWQLLKILAQNEVSDYIPMSECTRPDTSTWGRMESSGNIVPISNDSVKKKSKQGTTMNSQAELVSNL